MESKQTGRKISSIRVCKNKVVLYFKGNKIDISKEAYSSTYLYKGKIVSDSEYNTLKKSIDESTYLSYALKLLSRHYYSSYAMKEKLYKKGANTKVVEKTLRYLKDNKLIDDAELAKNIADSLLVNYYGKNRIKQKLIDKKLDYLFLDEYIDYKEEKEKCSQYYKIAIRKYASLSHIKKKEAIYRTLIYRGYDVSIVKEVIRALFKDDGVNDSSNLKKELRSVLNKGISKYDNQYEVKKYVIDTLRRKGYKYSDIVECLKETDGYEFN